MQIWSSKFTTYLHLSQTLINPFFRPVIEYDRPGERVVLNRTVVVGNNTLAQIYPNAPIIAHRKEKSLKDSLVRAKIPSL